MDESRLQSRADEQTVDDYFRDLGLRPEEFIKVERRAGKSPDRKVYRDDTLVLYCEVKTIELDQWLKYLCQHPDAVPSFIGGLNQVIGAVSTGIHQAIKQFDAVNPDLAVPNVLAFVNHSTLRGGRVLYGALTGELSADDGVSVLVPEFVRCSDGRIKDEKWRIEAYLWFDEAVPPRRIQTSEDKSRRDRLSDLLEMTHVG